MKDYQIDLKVRRAFLSAAQMRHPVDFDMAWEEDIATRSVGKCYLSDLAREEAGKEEKVKEGK